MVQFNCDGWVGWLINITEQQTLLCCEPYYYYYYRTQKAVQGRPTAKTWRNKAHSGQDLGLRSKDP